MFLLIGTSGVQIASWLMAWWVSVGSALQTFGKGTRVEQDSILPNHFM